MSGVRVEITGRDAAFANLHAMGERLDNAQPMYDEIGGYLDLVADLRFERETDPQGNPWPKSLRARATGGQTLTDSGLLRKSITHNAWATGVEHGSNSPYAVSHQFGITIKAKTSRGLRWKYRGAGSNQDQWSRKMEVTLPRRAFIGMDDDDEAEIIHIAESWLARSAGGPDAR